MATGLPSPNQTEVAHVLKVVVGNRVGNASAQQWLDHATHPFLLQLVSKLVQMGLAT